MNSRNKISKFGYTFVLTAFLCASLTSCDKNKETVKMSSYLLKADTNLKTATINSIVATDSLGRSFGESVSANSDRKVGMFYFVWHGEHILENEDGNGNFIVHDVTRESKNNPDFWNPNLDSNGEIKMKTLGDGSQIPSVDGYNQFYYFDEPLYGYYCTDDPWVLSKHIELLTMSNIDYISLDLTNWSIYEENITALLDNLLKYQSQGWNVPKVTSILNGTDPKAAHETRIKNFYDIFYSNPKYDSLWERDKYTGNPVITISISAYKDKLEDYVKNGLSFKNAVWPFNYGRATEGYDNLSWMDWNYPQSIYQNKDGGLMSVSVTQHNSGAFGYSVNPSLKDVCYDSNRGRGFDFTTMKNNPDKVLEGLNFETQWNNALQNKKDVDEVFVTGWNEWIAYKLYGKDLNFYEEEAEKIQNFDDLEWEKAITFCDTCNDEFSRDIEMTKEGYGDNFYLQNMRNTRKFKDSLGAKYYGEYATQFLRNKNWENARTYLDFKEEAFDRNFDRADHKVVYTTNNVRNDIESVQMSNDSNNLYLKIKTNGIINVDDSKTNNLNVLLSVNGQEGPKWENYNYVLNRSAIKNGEGTTKLEKIKTQNSFEFDEVCDCVTFSDFSEGFINIKIPLEKLNITNTADFTIDFKVADGIENQGNIMNYYTDGDCAPIGRLNYRYNSLHD